MSARLLAILESIPGEAYLALIELCATGFIAFVAVESYQCYRQYADVLSVLQVSRNSTRGIRVAYRDKR
jgi:hypothetical protein